MIELKQTSLSHELRTHRNTQNTATPVHTPSTLRWRMAYTTGTPLATPENTTGGTSINYSVRQSRTSVNINLRDTHLVLHQTFHSLKTSLGRSGYQSVRDGQDKNMNLHQGPTRCCRPLCLPWSLLHDLLITTHGRQPYHHTFMYSCKAKQHVYFRVCIVEPPSKLTKPPKPNKRRYG